MCIRDSTTGLHMSDIENLLSLFDLIVSRGNTLVVIEHNLDAVSYTHLDVYKRQPLC